MYEINFMKQLIADLVYKHLALPRTAQLNFIQTGIFGAYFFKLVITRTN